MRQDVEVRPGRARAYLVIGLVATLVALALLFAGRSGVASWAGLGFGAACLLVGTAQRSALRQRANE